MNIAFYLMVVMAIIAFWFLLAFVFKPVGKFLYKIFKDAEDAMKDEDETERKEENKHE